MSRHMTNASAADQPQLEYLIADAQAQRAEALRESAKYVVAMITSALHRGSEAKAA